MNTASTRDQVVAACGARLVGPSTYATADATDLQLNSARRLGEIFGQSQGLSFVVIPKIGDKITRAFEGVATDRNGHVTANFAIKNLDHLGEDLQSVAGKWVGHMTAFGDRGFLIRKLTNFARHVREKHALRTWGGESYAQHLEDEFDTLFGEYEQYGYLFAPAEPRQIRIFVDVSGDDRLSRWDTQALRAFTMKTRGLRIVMLWPDRVRIFMDGDQYDETGRPAD
jgi:hypothetical protein